MPASNDENGSKNTPFPPPLVTETLQYRLVTGNLLPGGQRGSLTRCIQSRKDVDYFRLELEKLLLQVQRAEDQVEANETAHQERLQQLDQLQQKVQTSQAQADASQQRRTFYLEYEALAKIANGLGKPSAELKQEIDDAKKRLQELQSKQDELDETWKVRQAQFQLLLQYMVDLKRSLNEEEDAEEEEGDDDAEDEERMNEAEVEPMQVDEEVEDGLYGDL